MNEIDTFQTPQIVTAFMIPRPIRWSCLTAFYPEICIDVVGQLYYVHVSHLALLTGHLMVPFVQVSSEVSIRLAARIESEARSRKHPESKLFRSNTEWNQSSTRNSVGSPALPAC